VVWWIAAAIVVLALVGLVVVALTLVRHLRALRHVLRALVRRADEAAALEGPVLALQERALAMQEQLIGIQDKVAERAARKAIADG
jgi:hypothetical protein